MPDKVGKTFVVVNKNQLLLGRTPRKLIISCGLGRTAFVFDYL